MRELLCLYCFERFGRRELAFRCTNERHCAPEEDHALASYLGLLRADKQQRVFTPGRNGWRLPASAVCDKCRRPSSKKVCPHCHNTLPDEFGQTASHIIALVGAKESGKSHYIAVLLNELEHKIGHHFKAALRPLDDMTIERYKQDFYHYLYQQRQTIPATHSARQLGKVRYPLIYEFKRMQASYFGVSRKATTLVFFDTAGEDLSNRDRVATEAKYLAHASGIIFLLDPLQIPAVRDRLGDAPYLPQQNTSPAEIVSRLIAQLKQAQGLRSHNRIATPLALAFSKLDVIRPLLDAASPLHEASRHQGYFDERDAARVHDNMRAHVARWIGRGLDQLVTENFTTSRYFGLSALGAPPDEQGRLLRGVAPFRVVDPLLWLFHRLKVIPGGRR